MAVVPSLRVLVTALLLSASPLCTCPAQMDTSPSSSLASITVELQTFGRPKADFPTTIQIHSSALESDLSSTSDNPSKIDFPNLSPGQYRITATAPSREPAQLDLTLSPGQTARLSLIVDRIFPLTLNLDAANSSTATSPSPMSESRSSLAAPLLTSPALPPVPSSSPAPTANPDAQPAAASSVADTPAPTVEPASSSPQPFVSTCSVDDVIPQVSTHVQQFVESINRITATELLEFERRNHKGKFEEDAKAKVNYVALIQPLRSGVLSVEEFRDGASRFPGHISATGSVALVLIFHPVHVNEFQMSCKGLTYWHNVPVYEIAFQQRPDVPNTMSGFRVNQESYDILLKGTAFVDADSFQILHLDTDLLKPIPDVLDLEHQSIDYGSVSFTTRSDQLWLPQFVTITVRFRNKEYLEHHAYSNYRLFSVDTAQKISKPTVPADANGPSPN